MQSRTAAAGTDGSDGQQGFYADDNFVFIVQLAAMLLFGMTFMHIQVHLRKPVQVLTQELLLRARRQYP